MMVCFGWSEELSTVGGAPVLRGQVTLSGDTVRTRGVEAVEGPHHCLSLPQWVFNSR